MLAGGRIQHPSIDLGCADGALPFEVLVECLQHFEDFALDLVEHGDRSFAADLDREQKISDRDDVAQESRAALSACSWSVWWQVPAERYNARSGRLRCACPESPVNYKDFAGFGGRHPG
jgi:hypothetical protein